MTYPKIGIRPTIDGRWGGVRESLEAQTMGMATAAKALIEENLHYPDGTPVQCVLSPTTFSPAKYSAHLAASAPPPMVVGESTHCTGVPSG